MGTGSRVCQGGNGLTDNVVWLGLLGSLDIGRDADRVQLPLGAQRLLALLALHEGGVHRAVAAERLWPRSRRTRAAANLRSALWQGRRIGDRTVIECSGPRLRLAPAVTVDLRKVLAEARPINDIDQVAHHVDEPEKIITSLSRELLPDWSDEWLLLERERWDQVRLHTLETLALNLMSLEKYLAGLQAAFAAVAIEPVRESAHRAVVEIYIAQGNSACALKHYQHYRGLVQRELGVTPSRQMNELVHPLICI